MKSVRRQAHVPFSPSQMFDLVNDVEAYPQFLPWCRHATVTVASESRREATLEVGIRGVTHTFSTCNTLERPARIGIELLQGPFRKLSGEWRFQPREGGSCEVLLALDFEAGTIPLRFLFEMLFEELIRSQVSAFVERAEAIYG